MSETAASGTAATTARAGTEAEQRAARILVIDNYDSFVFTIVGYLQQMGAATTVVRNDEGPEDAAGAVDLAGFDGVLVSPARAARAPPVDPST